jgi:hypothetical protein
MLLFTAMSVMADETESLLQVMPLITFNGQAKMTNWIVQGSKFATQGYPQNMLIKVWPDSVSAAIKENTDLNSLGIHSKFDRKGYNYIEIIPAKVDSSGNKIPTTIPVPGIVRRMDLWVWGSNYNYKMDIFLRDYRGIDHVLHLGTLQFIGWKDLSVTVPGSIPQARRYIPQYQGLELTKLVMWTAPDEKVDDNYLYLNDLTILTDTYQLHFDGEDLAKPDYVNQIWQQPASK